MSYSDKQLIDLLRQLDFAEGHRDEAHDYVAGFHRAIEMAIHIVETGKESNPSYSSRQTGVVNLEIPQKARPHTEVCAAWDDECCSCGASP